MSFIGPFQALLLLVVGVGLLTWTHVQNHTTDRHRIAAGGLLAASVAIALFVGASVAVEREPVAKADLYLGGTELQIPEDGSRHALLVRAELPPVGPEQSANGRYLLEITAPDGHTERLGAEVTEQWTKQRIARGRGRMSVERVHLEDRFDLPVLADSGTTRVKLVNKEGDIQGGLHVLVTDAPPGATGILAAGALLAAAAAVFDALYDRRTSLGYAVGVLAAFAGFLLANITPHGATSAVFGAAALALFVGLAGGGALRLAASAVVRRVRKPPVAA